MSAKSLTDKEQAALKKFETMIADVKDTHIGCRDLIHWLQAKSWNLKKAEEMYRKNQQWRKDIGIDQLVHEYKEPEVMTKYYAGGVVGHGKDGCIIRVDPIGRNDIKGLIRSMKKYDIIMSMVMRFEHTLVDMDKWRAEHDSKGDQVIQILDLSGVSYGGMEMQTIHFYLESMKLLDNRYPGLVKKSYIINAPYIFNLAWSFMKRFLSKEVTEKFEICDGRWKERLAAELPVDQIPAAYGGTKVSLDGDPMCKTLICYGGEVPSSYYRTVEKCLPPDESTIAHVRRADIMLVEAAVTAVPTTLSWVFASEGNPLIFGIFRETTPGKRDLGSLEVIQSFREVDSHIVPEDGLITCEQPGTYFLVFDNISSRFTRRKVTYMFGPSKKTHKIGSESTFQE